MNKILGQYQNGNYIVTIYNDGTKIRENDKDSLIPEFAESIDITITEKCDGLCPFCYSNSSQNKLHGNILNMNLINSFHPYTEIAINGNDLSHPDLDEFLRILKEKNIIVNMTINQRHFMKYYRKIKNYIDNQLIKGLGISFASIYDKLFLKLVKKIDNAVIHTINGILTYKDIMFLMENDLKLLILGYKNKGRGINYIKENETEIKNNQQFLKDNLKFVQSVFKLISFDNLALEQLDVKNTLNVSDDKWNEFYMGDEGQYTFFIDLVNNKFARSSLEIEEQFDLLDSVDDMFKIIRNLK